MISYQLTARRNGRRVCSRQRFAYQWFSSCSTPTKQCWSTAAGRFIVCVL